ncbi:hypothetical protein CH291_06860 [Rhodococcus sp. 14-1411-2a]|nr:hypothetical protein CH291_06860 [Rhodococcus sp. 14-1411-2a]
MDAIDIKPGQPWYAAFPSGYRCIAVKRMKPKVDDTYEWVIIGSDGRSTIGDLPEDLELQSAVPTSRSSAPARAIQTPSRNFRIPDAVYQPARDVAAANGETVTDVVVRSLILYTERANPQSM